MSHRTYMSASANNIPLADLVNRPVYLKDWKHHAYASAAFNISDGIYHQVLQPQPNTQQQWIIKFMGVHPLFKYNMYTINDVKHGWFIASGQSNDDRLWHDSPTQTPSNKLWQFLPLTAGSSINGYRIIDIRWGESIGASDNFDGQMHHQPNQGRSNYIWDIIVADVPGYCKSLGTNSFLLPVCQEMGPGPGYDAMATAYCGGGDGGVSRLITNSKCTTWCKANPSLCDSVMTDYCRNNQSASECRCIYGTSQPNYITARSKYPEIAAPVACWAEAGCQGANFLDTLITTDRLRELTSCPNVTVMRQNIDIANSGVIGILDVDQQQTSTTVTNTTTTPIPGTAPLPPVSTTTTNSSHNGVPTAGTGGGSTLNYTGNAPLASGQSQTWMWILLIIFVFIIVLGTAALFMWDDDDAQAQPEVGVSGSM